MLFNHMIVNFGEKVSGSKLQRYAYDVACNISFKYFTVSKIMPRILCFSEKNSYMNIFRNVYLVTNGQIPHWLNLDNDRIKIITHDEIFKVKSDLPSFSSAAIESNLHRIPGLSENFLYLNDDILLNQPISIHDFYDPLDGWRIYLAWDVPQCAPDCPNNWIQDGYCDKLCNVAACEFDGGDCIRSDAGIFEGEPDSSWNDNDGIAQLIQTNSKITQCSKNCLVSWLGDKFCDHSCNNKPCAFDMGDCGVTEYNSRIHQISLNEKESLLPQSENIFFFNLTDFNFISGHVSSSNVPILSVRVSNLAEKLSRTVRLVLVFLVLATKVENHYLVADH